MSAGSRRVCSPDESGPMTLLLEDGLGLLLEDGTALLLEDGSSTPETPTTVYLRGPAKSSLRTVELDATTDEALDVDVWCNVDPTGASPRFAVTAEGTRVAVGASFSLGSWVTDWGDDGWLVARTPQFGSDFTLTAGTRLWVWIKTTAGGESAVWQIGTVVVL